MKVIERSYHGQIVKVRGNIRQQDFKFLDVPEGSVVEGFRWTACSDITPQQTKLILACAVLSIFTDKGVKWIQIPLRKVPMVMDMDQKRYFVRRGFMFNGRWLGVIDFHGTEWSSFPGQTRVKVEAVAPTVTEIP